MTRTELLKMAKPILFTSEMVMAILEGRKTVTRRYVKPQPTYSPRDGFSWKGYAYGTDLPQTEKGAAHNFLCNAPCKVGDILYVRETWHKYIKRVGKGENCRLQKFYGYKASIANSEDANESWKPSIHMPKEAARIFLKVTDVRVERLQDITIDGIRNEGLTSMAVHAGDTEIAYEEWQQLWNSTIKQADFEQYSWDANPWVWAIEFERIELDGEEEILGLGDDGI